MGRKIALAVAFASFWIASSLGQEPMQPRQVSLTLPIVSRSGRMLIQQIADSAYRQDDECSACKHAMEDGGKCSDVTKECKGGSVRSCYLAAACLCQCNLDAGGCGSDRDALKECVDKNQKNAHDMD